MIVRTLKRAFIGDLSNPRFLSTMRMLAWQRVVPGVWETSE